MRTTAEILLVEDSRADQRLVLQALKGSPFVKEPHVVEDGQEALEFLQRRGRHPDSPVPDLVILDLNLPRRDGRDVLRELKKDPDLKRIPVIILTTSDSPDDVVESYQLGANVYFQKPIDLDDYLRMVKVIEDCWLSRASLPTGISERPEA